MLNQKDIEEHLEKVEKYILGELSKRRLDTQIISLINANEGRIWKVRRLLKWILTEKYVKFESDRDDLDLEDTKEVTADSSQP